MTQRFILQVAMTYSSLDDVDGIFSRHKSSNKAPQLKPRKNRPTADGQSPFTNVGDNPPQLPPRRLVGINLSLLVSIVDCLIQSYVHRVKADGSVATGSGHPDDVFEPQMPTGQHRHHHHRSHHRQQKRSGAQAASTESEESRVAAEGDC